MVASIAALRLVSLLFKDNIMFDFYLIASVITNIFLFLVWKKEDLLNLSIKTFLLILSMAGTLVVINTYHMIGA